MDGLGESEVDFFRKKTTLEMNGIPFGFGSQVCHWNVNRHILGGGNSNIFWNFHPEKLGKMNPI